MPIYDKGAYDCSREEDIKGEARVSAFMALRKAWKDRAAASGLRAADLANMLGKDKGYVSRVLRGTTKTITLETLFVFLEALGFVLKLNPERIEDMSRSNFDGRPEIQPLSVEPIVRGNNSITVTAATITKSTSASQVRPVP
jgi:transcriptional regulator with XRE-family HTH domain